MNESSSVIVCERISKTYHLRSGDVLALPRTDLSLKQREMVAIMGPSGSGKSTLLSLLAGLDRPTTGDVLFMGHAYSSMTQSQLTAHRRTNVGFIFQTSNLVSGLNVHDNIAMPLWLCGWPESKVESRVNELMERLGIASLAKRTPNQLSGGERQRVAICRAVAHRPVLILADEPTGSLDRANADKVAELMFSAASEEGCTLVVATHSQRLADMMSRVVSLGDEPVESIS